MFLFGSPAFNLRKKMIRSKLENIGAVSRETAVTLEEANVFNPNAFPRLTQSMVEDGVLGITSDKKYYLIRN